MSKKLLLSVSILATITLLAASQDTDLDVKSKNKPLTTVQTSPFIECEPFPECLVWPKDASANSIPLAILTNDELTTDEQIDSENSE